jgi:hypothetical protein
MDVEEIVESIKIGEGNLMRETKTGTLKFEITQLNGKKFIVTLNDVEYVPNLCVILFGLNK